MLEVDDLFERRPVGDVQKILKTLSRSGVSEILFCLERASLRFSQLMFETRLNPGVVDRHLKALQRLNLVEKKDGVYELTPTGREVTRIIRHLSSIV